MVQQVVSEFAARVNNREFECVVAEQEIILLGEKLLIELLLIRINFH